MMRFQPTFSVRTQTLGVSGSTGFGVVPGAATKGAWSTIGTTSFDFHALCVGFPVENAASDIIVDLGINVGGNIAIIAADLRNDMRANFVSGAVQQLPLYVPRGTVLTLRGESVSATSFRVQVIGLSRGLLGVPGFARCHRLYTPTTRLGQAIDPGATANTKGAWTQLIASTPGVIRALTFSLDQAGDVARTAATWLLDIGIGAAGSEQVIIPNLQLVTDATTSIVTPNTWGPVPISIPSGVRVAARAACSINTAGDRTFGLNVWGFSP